MSYQKGIKVFTVILIVLVALAAVALYFMSTANAIRANPIKPFEEAKAEATNDPDHINYEVHTAAAAQNAITVNGEKYVYNDKIVNILLLGIDSDTTQRSQGRTGWRSDMIMLCSVNFETSDITMLSIPRDTRTKVYHVDEKGKITKTVTDKLNAAYSYGGGPDKFSAENAMRCTAEFLECDSQVDVPIDYYMSIDLEGLPKLADVLDGVEVTLDQKFPGLGKKGEVVELRGDKVRKFLENRKDMQNGEYDRQKHERDFMMAVAKKVKSMGAAKAAPKLFPAFMDFMKTNLSLDKVLGFAGVLDKANLDSMKFEGLTEGTDGKIKGIWYYQANEEEVLQKMLDIMYIKQ